MRLLVFTSNQPRHAALVRALQAQHHDLAVIVEPKTFGPFTTPPDPVGRYWDLVRAAEHRVFGPSVFLEVPTLCVRPDEVSHLTTLLLPEIERADRVLVFSASYLRPPLVGHVLAKGALNLHSGIAPEYRGSACNFWAEYDGHPELVGAQIQVLAERLDAGRRLAEIRADLTIPDPFLRGMDVIQRGIRAMVRCVITPDVEWPHYGHHEPIRYSRHADFTADVVQDYLARIGR